MRLTPRKFGLPRGAYAVLDQALASLASVGAILGVLVTAGRQEVGLLLWMLAPTYLFIGVQNALVTSPYLTLNGGLPALERDQKRALAAWLGVLFVIVAAGVVSVTALSFWLGGDSRFDPLLVLSFAMGMAGLLLREQERSFAYAQQAVSAALTSTLIYGALLVLGLILIAATIGVGARSVFLVMGTAGIGAALLSPTKRRGVRPRELIAEAKGYLRLGRWAIVGVVFAWLLGNAYPLYIEQRFGLLEVAEVGVARLWLMPVALLVPAFVNFYRPQMAELLARGASSTADQIVLRVVIIVGVSSTLPLLLIFTLDQFEMIADHGWRLPALRDMAAWAIYFFVFAARSMIQIFMLGDERGYRQLSVYSFAAFFLVVAILSVLPGDAGYAVVLAMAIVEGILALIVMRTIRAHAISQC